MKSFFIFLILFSVYAHSISIVFTSFFPIDGFFHEKSTAFKKTVFFLSIFLILHNTSNYSLQYLVFFVNIVVEKIKTNCCNFSKNICNSLFCPRIQRIFRASM